MVRHSSRIELSQSALNQNLKFIRSKIGPNTIFSSVVKANAFGHGIDAFVPMAEKAGIRHFSVASSFEAFEVSHACSKDSTVMIMGILYDDDMTWVIENEIEFFVFDLQKLKTAQRIAEKLKKRAVIHLEIETGGNRTGLDPDTLPEALDFLAKHKDTLLFQGFCTHFAGIETLANQFRIVRQQQTFDDLYDRVCRQDVRPRYRHTACSAAVLAFPETVMDLVRVGTAHYGMWPSQDIYNLHLKQTGKKNDRPLKRVLSWKTDIMHTKELQTGDYVGYGTSFKAEKDMRIAVIPLGYSNGYPRAMSNRGEVLIQGDFAPITGLINMNVFMVDITHIPKASVGDEVVLIGRQKGHEINIRSFTDTTRAINNELVSRLPTAIPRVVVA